jgi:hypothetical protein
LSTASDVIAQAYRENNILGIGITPNDAQNAEALVRLQRFCRSLIGTVYGENMLDWQVPAPQRTAPVAANYPQLPYPQGLDALALTQPFTADPTINIWPYPPTNSRIIFGETEDQHVWFPEAPLDGSRMAALCGATIVGTPTLLLDGNGRAIAGSPTVSLAAPFSPQEWVYRADLGGWFASADFALTDQMPFSPTMDDLFVTGLALRLAPAYTKTLAPETTLVFKNALAAFRARYRQAANTVYGSQDFPRSLQSYISGRWYW